MLGQILVILLAPSHRFLLYHASVPQTIQLAYPVISWRQFIVVSYLRPTISAPADRHRPPRSCMNMFNLPFFQLHLFPKGPTWQLPCRELCRSETKDFSRPERRVCFVAPRHRDQLIIGHSTGPARMPPKTRLLCWLRVLVDG